MLQRIQTVYMLASVIAVAMMLFVPLGVITVYDAADQETILANFELTGLGLSSVTPEVVFGSMRYALLCLLLLMALLPLVCIFLYNRRKLQMRVMIYTAILDALFYGYFFLIEPSACQELAKAAVMEGGLSCVSEIAYQFVLFAMPALSIFCSVMAVKGIAYDIALLASADRLRPSRNG